MAEDDRDNDQRSSLTRGQEAQVAQVVRRLINENDRYPNEILDRVLDGKDTRERLQDFIQSEIRTADRRRPHFWQRSFYDDKAVRGIAVGSVLAVMVSVFLHFSHYINVRDIFHSVAATESYVAERISKNPDNHDSLQDVIAAQVRRAAIDNDGGLDDILHTAIEQRPILVYADRRLLTVDAISEDLYTEECRQTIESLGDEIARFQGEIDAATANPDNLPEAEVNGQIEAKRKLMDATRREIVAKHAECSTVVNETNAQFPFFADFGKAPAQSHEVRAIVSVSVADPDKLAQGKLEFRPLKTPSGRGFEVFSDFPHLPDGRIGDAFIKALPGATGGEVTVSLNDAYWGVASDGTRAGSGVESPKTHTLRVEIDPEIIAKHRFVTISAAIFVNKRI